MSDPKKSQVSLRSLLDAPDEDIDVEGDVEFPRISRHPHHELSDDEREALHFRLDALLNGVRRIQRMSDPEYEAPRHIIRQNRIDLCRQAASFLGDICGDWIKLSENDGLDPLDFVRMSLQVWKPVLDMQDEHDFFWEDVLEELSNMPFGDEPEIFVSAPRPPGTSKQPAKLTQKRLTALQWAEFLRAREIKPKAYKQQISLAYGADFETIRKWRLAAEKLFGSDFVNDRLQDASRGFGLPNRFPDYAAPLHAYGQQYRNMMGFSEIDIDVFIEATFGKDNS